MVKQGKGNLPFEDYSAVYDALYRDKDYQAETDFLGEVFNKYAKSHPQTILDLGCGSGAHAFGLTRRGYRVTGVDRSERMLELAREHHLSKTGTLR